MFSINNVIVRFLFTSLLVFGTYNPFGFSYFHWLLMPDPMTLLPKILVGLLLFLAFRMIFVSSLLALGIFGSFVVGLTITALLATLIQFGLIPLSFQATQVILPLGVALFFGIGVSYSGIANRLSRQTQSHSIGGSLF